jgi:hypothetical protein
MESQSQRNLWRYYTRQATLEALREKRPFSEFRREAEEHRAAMSQVLRAMFIAKVDGEEYSRWPRRH